MPALPDNLARRKHVLGIGLFIPDYRSSSCLFLVGSSQFLCNWGVDKAHQARLVPSEELKTSNLPAALHHFAEECGSGWNLHALGLGSLSGCKVRGVLKKPRG